MQFYFSNISDGVRISLSISLCSTLSTSSKHEIQISAADISELEIIAQDKLVLIVPASKQQICEDSEENECKRLHSYALPNIIAVVL